MPLTSDGEYRGPHATHVQSRRKFGRHRTLITAAMPLVDWLHSLETVVLIDFGRVVGSAGGDFTPRVESKITGEKIRLLLATKDVAQVIDVTTKSPFAATQVAAMVKEKWESSL